MKRVIATAIVALLFLPQVLFAQDKTMRHNDFLDRDEIFNEDNELEGYVKENKFLDEHRVYDEDNNYKGYWKRNEYLNQWEYREEE